MSNCCSNTQFSPEKDTWTKSSDLSFSNWDPYPELQPKSCWQYTWIGPQWYSLENYEQPSSTYSQVGKAWTGHVANPGFSGLLLRGTGGVTVGQARATNMANMREKQIKENFSASCCNSNPYNTISNTWKPQDLFTL